MDLSKDGSYHLIAAVVKGVEYAGITKNVQEQEDFSEER